nr:hypothetical protein CFP56_10642 [Quercus suber]
MRVGTWDSFTHEKEGGSSFVEERDGSSSSASESDELEASPELWKKSNSTGFSKLWRFRELVHRSNSDGKERGLALQRATSNAGEREREKILIFGWVYSDLPKQWAG